MQCMTLNIVEEITIALGTTPNTSVIISNQLQLALMELDKSTPALNQV